MVLPYESMDYNDEASGGEILTFENTFSIPGSGSFGSVIKDEATSTVTYTPPDLSVYAPIASPTFTGNASFATLSSTGNGVFNGLRVGDMGYGPNSLGLQNNALGTPNNYAIIQVNNGATYINASSGQSIYFSIGDVSPRRMTIDTNGVSTTVNGVFNGLRVGDMGHGSSYAGITHSALSLANNYAILQQNNGQTMINSSVGQPIKIRSGNITEYGEFNGTQLKINQYGFYSTPGVTVNTVTPLIYFVNWGGVARWWCRASDNTGGLIAASNNNFPSDDRLKYNETAFSNGIELVKQLRPTKYDQVNSVDDDESTGVPQYGFIADEIESIPGLDILVNEKPDQHYPDNGETVKALNYNGVMTISVQALKEVIDLVEDQQTEISRLTADVTSLNDRIATLENQRTENESILTDIVSRLHALEEM